MKRRVRSAKDDSEWTVRLVWTPELIRPVSLHEVYSDSAGPAWGAMGRTFNASLFGVVFSILVFLVLAVPTMLVVLPLRYAGVLSWRIEAVSFPWGRGKGPAVVKTWRVKGRHDDLERVVHEIAASFERGDENPQVAGAVLDQD